MTLELHVWAPAFGLASLDPECLATIAYFSQALEKSEWKLVRSSPSAVPTHHLPALHNPTTTPPTWTAGLTAITSHLRANPPPTFRDPDAHLCRRSRADAAAHAAHLRSAAGALLAVSLYASPSNWVDVSRPVLSAALPVPLAWTEATAVRTRWIDAAERAGLAGLDVDGEAASGGEGRKGTAGSQLTASRDAAGWVRGPKGLGGGAAAAAKEAAAASAEARARARLDDAVAEVMDVLVGLKAGKRWFLGDGGDEERSRPTTLDCLAFGYLALMLVPDLPRPWLRDAMERRYAGLCSFVNDMRSSCFGGMVTALPWSPAPSHDSIASVTMRFARGVVRSIPGVGEQWQRWWEGRNQDGVTTDGRADLLLAAGGILAAAAVVTGFVFRKDIPAIGAPIQRWERPQTGLRSFGAAGAMFGFISEAGADNRGSLNGGSVVVEEKTPIGEVEVAVDVEPGSVN